ncbi:MAG: hypothetical protein IPL70_03135 [Uliginosibacterium sp.]|jgi:general secretion pathway protein J|nr:hypothetical protein [Uliginosibacterium sp.]
MLIALALLALLVVALTISIRTISQAQTKVDERLSKNEAVRLSAAFLRQTLSWASLKKRMPLDKDAPQLGMVGTAEEITWIGLLPARYGAGGLYWLRLAVINSKLIFSFMPFLGMERAPDWSIAETRELLQEVSRISVAFQEDGSSAWADSWASADKLPQRVRLGVDAKGVNWPGLIVAVRSGRPATERSGGPVHGPVNER